MKQGKKLLAIVLSIGLAGIPISAQESLGTIDLSKQSFLSTDVPVIVNEEISLREDSAKHFRLSDGSYTAVVYDTPIHYKQGDEWVDIDNSLVSASLIGDPMTGIIKQDTKLTENEKDSVSQYKKALPISTMRNTWKMTLMTLKYNFPKELTVIRLL